MGDDRKAGSPGVAEGNQGRGPVALHFVGPAIHRVGCKFQSQGAFALQKESVVREGAVLRAGDCAWLARGTQTYLVHCAAQCRCAQERKTNYCCSQPAIKQPQILHLALAMARR